MGSLDIGYEEQRSNKGATTMKNNLMNKGFGRLFVIKKVGRYKNREVVWH